ncbi:FAD-binding oxidoreductase [Dyadobacter beijingensis]|nr:FAD-binding oxidoreductase [Dyadobacter beijingensis]
METNSSSQAIPYLRGRVIAPNDADYDTARKVHNGMIDKRPGLIAQCADENDVAHAVRFAREHGLVVAVRGGGHNGAGLGVCDQGLVIDLSQMRQVTVDPEAQTIRAQGGCLLGDLDKAGHPHGLAVPTGINATTGIGGLTLGGGLGHLTRFAGLTIDNLLEATVVLASGDIVTASPAINEDLFWAIRGGGGNFGVVTSFLFRAHNVHTVYGGPMFWDISEAKAMMEWYQDFIKQAPDTVSGFFNFHKIPPAPIFPEQYHLHLMCGIVWACIDEEEANEVFEMVRKFRKPLIDAVGPMPVPVLQTMFDDLFVPGLQWYWKGDFVKQLSPEVMDVHIRHAHRIPNFFSGMHLYPINGAAGRVPNDATAWSYRDATWSMVIAGVSPEPSEKDVVTNFARDYWQELHPHGAGGAYVNFMMEEGADRVKATYGSNYDRLVKVKSKYDPDNVFCVNQNIRPV